MSFEDFCTKAVANKNVVAGMFVAIVLVLALILMQVWKVGYYKKSAAEHLGDSGVEIPPDYVDGTELTNSIIPNQYGGNSTGGITKGSAGRHGQENSSGTASNGDGRSYIYTARLDDNTRSYYDAENPTFAAAHTESATTEDSLLYGNQW
jgi:hypothetical protein